MVATTRMLVAIAMPAQKRTKRTTKRMTKAS